MSISVLTVLNRYTQEEQPGRLGITACGSAIGSLVGQGIDFAAVNIGGKWANEPWRWMYVVIGSVSIGVGLIDLLVLPDSPTRAPFFTEREKVCDTQSGRNIAMKLTVNRS